MLSCPDQLDLQHYIEGRLPVRQGRGIEEHLSACIKCREEKNALRAEEDIAARLRTAFRDRAASGLHPESIDPASIEPEPPLRAGGVIEGYAIQEEIARGGMGVVYKAVQRSTNRTVALKVMLEGPFASASTRRRFQREVELAAALEHPNIVPLFDSGKCGDHQYFAMQYVDGVSLDTYLEANDLPIRERLGLFLQLCAAVNHAHQRGVIHRDLKPSNILVDGGGHLCVLDFGLAKVATAVASDASNAIAEGSTPRAGLPAGSITGQVLGTLPYMSPEQVSGHLRDVDVRTDIYSMGVMLFEMLTADFPYDVEESLSKTLRNITEALPRSPAELTRGLAADRRVDRELEAIVLQMLSKAKERRYQSVGDLVRDIEHYLKGEAIEARRNSRLYVLRKALSRYRVYVAAVLFVFAAVCAVSIVSLRMYVQMLELNQSHARAASLEAELALSQGRHDEALEKAEQALGLDPRLSDARLLRANALLQMDRREEAMTYLDHLVEVDPQSWAAHYALAEIHSQDSDRSRFHQQRVLDLRPDTAEAYYASSIVATDREAVEWLNKALARNPMHYESRVRRAWLNIRADHWEEAIADADVAVRLRSGDYHGWWLKGEVLLRHRKYAAAVGMFDEAIKLKHGVAIHYARATTYRRLQEYGKAIEDYDWALKLSRAPAGPRWLLYHRATLQWITGNHEAALEDYDRFHLFHAAPFWSDARRFFILMELSREEEARRHLEDAWARSEEGGWLRCVFEYLLSRRSAESLLEMAGSVEKQCEATYYIAERSFQEGDHESARRFYKACLDTGVDRYIIPGEVTPSSEYELSEWRLAAMNSR